MGALLLLLVLHQLVPSLGLDLCSAITFSSGFICTPIKFPSGVAAKTCKEPLTGIKYVCGATITYTSKSLCPSSLRQVADRANNLCRCSGQLIGWVQKAPGLIQKGAIEAADTFTGVTSPILSGAAADVACITNAGLGVKDVDKVQLLSQLTSELSDVTISGTRAYDYHMWPAITFADYVDLGARALCSCGCCECTLQTAGHSSKYPSQFLGSDCSHGE
ncbi:hypothetical protein OEZ86_002031 [Tetradesmus obliquus]|nr:hypothetical protein OEZ86_002031 [Tetradesmus obliquus]